ncbi:MAG: hypothetical protein HC810_05135 [Acaryochloridaceae cyanobacterium RL_2_7]|nr:hypothetical protein [Acaryochloridaceae cyanobacterium RL_2_7]
MFLVAGNENITQIRHHLFTLVTFVVFHIYFAFGGRPFLQLLPLWLQYGYQGGIILLSLLWLRRVWGGVRRLTRLKGRPQNSKSLRQCSLLN